MPCVLQVLKGFDWVSRLLFHADDLLVLGFHTVSHATLFALVKVEIFGSKH